MGKLKHGTYKLDGFSLFISDEMGGEWKGKRYISLNFEPSRAQDCIEYIKRKNITSIRVSTFFDKTTKNLDFLDDLKDFLEEISILNFGMDISNLIVLEKVKKIVIDEKPNCEIDLSNFSYLEKFASEYSNKYKNLSTCKNLKSLYFDKYESKSGTLEELPYLPNLEKLDLRISNKISSLKGIEKFQNLKEIHLYSLKNLLSIDGIQHLPKLESLEMAKSKFIDDFQIISKCKSLKRLIYERVNDIEDKAFLNKLDYKVDKLYF